MNTPMLNKMKEVKEKSQAIGDFIEQMRQEGYYFCSVLPKQNSSEDAWIIRNDTMDSLRKGDKVLVILQGDEWAAFEHKINIGHPKEIAAEILKFFHNLYIKGTCIAKDMPVILGIPTSFNLEDALGEHFGIDLDEAEKERRELLAFVRRGFKDEEKKLPVGTGGPQSNFDPIKDGNGLIIEKTKKSEVVDNG